MIKKEPMSTSGPLRIEAYDVAHISGKHMIGVMVVMNDGEFDKNEYRKFNIKSVTGANDTQALHEILARRFAHKEWNLPDVVVIDGGTAQINVAKKVVPKDVNVVSVVKDARHKAREILTVDSTHEFGLKIKELQSDIIKINAEAHRFAITAHRKKRDRLV